MKDKTRKDKPLPKIKKPVKEDELCVICASAKVSREGSYCEECFWDVIMGGGKG